MSTDKACIVKEPKGLSFFERHLSIRVLLCMAAGIILEKRSPGSAQFLDGPGL